MIPKYLIEKTTKGPNICLGSYVQTRVEINHFRRSEKETVSHLCFWRRETCRTRLYTSWSPHLWPVPQTPVTSQFVSDIKPRIYLWLEHSCSGRSEITEDIVALLWLQKVLHLLHQSYILWKLNYSCPNIRSPWGPYGWWVFDNGATERQPHKYHRILISPEQDGLRLNRYKAYKVEVINWSV